MRVLECDIQFRRLRNPNRWACGGAFVLVIRVMSYGPLSGGQMWMSHRATEAKVTAPFVARY